MKQLSGMDNLFLEMEQGNQYMHVAGLGIYDPSTAPGGHVRFKQVLKFFSDRLNTSKVFRRRLVTPPFGMDRPYWVEDGDIDVEYHVRHIALPRPGDWRQLMIQVARIHSRPLDRSRPLWEIYIIEGLDNIPGLATGSFALFIKFHHAAVDGESGTQIIKAIHSISTDPEDKDAIISTALVADRDPTLIELSARAIGNRSRQVLDAAKLVTTLGARLAKAGTGLILSGRIADAGHDLVGNLTDRNRLAKALGRKPHTRFDEPVSAHRVVDAVSFPLADCKKIRAHVEGVTINDIFLAACGGAVRKYLEGKGELPSRSLSALMPISTRGDDKTSDVGNQIGMVPVSLRSDVADPIPRLLAVKRSSRKSKNASSLLGHGLGAEVMQVLPSAATIQIVKQGLVPMCNATVSNVRGPDVPLYMAGAKLQMFMPVSVALDGIGLNMTGFSYDGTLWVCFVSCRKMLPDPELFARCLNEGFDEMLAAALKMPRFKKDEHRPRREHAVARTQAAEPTPARSGRQSAKPKAAAKTPQEPTGRHEVAAKTAKPAAAVNVRKTTPAEAVHQTGGEVSANRIAPLRKAAGRKATTA